MRCKTLPILQLCLSLRRGERSLEISIPRGITRSSKRWLDLAFPSEPETPWYSETPSLLRLTNHSKQQKIVARGLSKICQVLVLPHPVKSVADKSRNYPHLTIYLFVS